jgi:hypothetical protein
VEHRSHEKVGIIDAEYTPVSNAPVLTWADLLTLLPAGVWGAVCSLL